MKNIKQTSNLQVPTNIILNQDCLKGLKLYPDKFFHCCVTSPPYFRLRDYQVNGQIGQEQWPEEYITKLVDIFREVKRVLRPEGTIWINIGDSYFSHKKRPAELSTDVPHSNLKCKDLIGIPWMLAFALRDIGLYLRQDIIWHKPSPMPEGVKDRCTKSHEYLFLLSKSREYYYDQNAVSQTLKISSIQRQMRGVSSKNKYREGIPGQPVQRIYLPRDNVKQSKRTYIEREDPAFKESKRKPASVTGQANLRSVWTLHTKGYKGNHFATFPEEIPFICIKAGCPEHGIVLDPFLGAGTTALVARKLSRNYVGFELNPKYAQMAMKRLHRELGIFL
ncbi:site-specific DNA-methyltransferase [Chitinophaga sp. MM2321]|uniref:DNA-methyltransferase n=1 Tax=Chitinophaga sp. MM2321 TaxID=3137178 RepID=UPI0032D588E1